MSDFWEVLIAGLGVVIAALQVRLSKQINEQSISRERGFLIVEETNIRKREDNDYKKCIGLFNLDKPIKFDIHGNGDIFLLEQIISVNGHVVERKEALETFIINGQQIVKQGIELSLKNCHKAMPRIEIEITFKMKNIINYKYIEVISLCFEKNDNETLWFLKRQNTRFIK